MAIARRASAEPRPPNRSTTRILLLGHTYLVEENQKKVAALARVPGVDVALVVPRRWRDPLQGELRAHVPNGTSFTTLALPAVWSGREQFYWYAATDIGLRRFQPDVLLVEQGGSAVVYGQALIYRRLYSPRTKAAFFTWWNVPYRARWPLNALERFNLAHSDGGVAGNADAAAILHDHGFSAPLLVLPQLGVDPVAFAGIDESVPRQEAAMSRFTIGFVGRLVEEKGVRVLLDALRGLPYDADLLLVGAGPLAEEAARWAAANGWEKRLTIVDVVAHDRVADHLRRMDVLVLPSLDRSFWREQFGHVLIEAMSCGVPVVGSDGGEIPHVIGDAGVVVPQGDAPALRQALAALANSPERRRQLAIAGRRRVLDHFTHDRIAERLVAFLRAL